MQGKRVTYLFLSPKRSLKFFFGLSLPFDVLGSESWSGEPSLVGFFLPNSFMLDTEAVSGATRSYSMSMTKPPFVCATAAARIRGCPLDSVLGSPVASEAVEDPSYPSSANLLPL